MPQKEGWNQVNRLKCCRRNGPQRPQKAHGAILLHFSIQTNTSKIFPHHFISEVDRSKQKASVKLNSLLNLLHSFHCNFASEIQKFSFFSFLRTERVEATSPLELQHSFGLPTMEDQIVTVFLQGGELFFYTYLLLPCVETEDWQHALLSLKYTLSVKDLISTFLPIKWAVISV